MEIRLLCLYFVLLHMILVISRMSSLLWVFLLFTPDLECDLYCIIGIKLDPLSYFVKPLMNSVCDQMKLTREQNKLTRCAGVCCPLRCSSSFTKSQKSSKCSDLVRKILVLLKSGHLQEI